MFDDIRVPLFTPSIPVSLMDHPLHNAKRFRILKKRPTQGWLPLQQSPYSHTVYPHIPHSILGTDIPDLKEEFVRHYVSPSYQSIHSIYNTWDSYYESNLLEGIDVHTVPHSSDYTFTPYESAFSSGYVPMTYVPTPVILTKKESDTLDWTLTQFPHFKPLIDSYRNTKTPQIWFEFILQLKEISDINPSNIREDLLKEIKSKLSLPMSSSLEDINNTIKDRKKYL